MTVVQQDISTIVADAIVHPTNSSLAVMGQVGQALEQAGGKEFIKELQDLSNTSGSLSACEGNLRYKFKIE